MQKTGEFDPPEQEAAQAQEIREESEGVACDRCSSPMFRMRAVYWCTNCGYKTDCCGS